MILHINYHMYDLNTTWTHNRICILFGIYYESFYFLFKQDNKKNTKQYPYHNLDF